MTISSSQRSKREKSVDGLRVLAGQRLFVIYNDGVGFTLAAHEDGALLFQTTRLELARAFVLGYKAGQHGK